MKYLLNCSGKARPDDRQNPDQQPIDGQNPDQ